MHGTHFIAAAATVKQLKIIEYYYSGLFHFNSLVFDGKKWCVYTTTDNIKSNVKNLAKKHNVIFITEQCHHINYMNCNVCLFQTKPPPVNYIIHLLNNMMNKINKIETSVEEINKYCEDDSSSGSSESSSGSSGSSESSSESSDSNSGSSGSSYTTTTSSSGTSV